MKEGILKTHADLVFLQEIIGKNEKYEQNLEDWPRETQFEFLADTVWTHFSYGKNATTSPGHHGNAVLSKLPIEFSNNLDISTSRMEQRGLLHVKTAQFDIFCTHLNLMNASRRKQLQKIVQYITQNLDPKRPLILAGDFNDWSQDLHEPFEKELQLKEAFVELQGYAANSFPSALPFLKLDRVYYRGFHAKSAECLKDHPWDELSDHLPLLVELELMSNS